MCIFALSQGYMCTYVHRKSAHLFVRQGDTQLHEYLSEVLRPSTRAMTLNKMMKVMGAERWEMGQGKEYVRDKRMVCGLGLS